VQRSKASPSMSFSRSHLKVNEWLRINCSSGGERTRLKWFINEIEAKPENVRQYKKSLGLHLQVKKSQHQFILRCRSLYNEVLAETASTLLLESNERQELQAQSVSSNSSIAIDSCLHDYNLLVLLVMRLLLQSINVS
jgi:hypothetical protein